MLLAGLLYRIAHYNQGSYDMIHKSLHQHIGMYRASVGLRTCETMFVIAVACYYFDIGWKLFSLFLFIE